MCLLCVEILKGNMTSKEVSKALSEYTPDADHETELFQVISDSYTLDELWDAVPQEDWDPMYDANLIPGWEDLT